MAEPVKFTKALMDYFTQDGKRPTAAEYKDLTRKDKEEFREMLIKEGIDVEPLPPEKS